jgi:hypothetical protein
LQATLHDSPALALTALRTIAELGWDSTFPKDLFIQKAAPRARAASDSTEATKAHHSFEIRIQSLGQKNERRKITRSDFAA